MLHEIHHTQKVFTKKTVKSNCDWFQKSILFKMIKAKMPIPPRERCNVKSKCRLLKGQLLVSSNGLLLLMLYERK